MDEDIEWLGGGGGESDREKWFEGSTTKTSWSDSSHQGGEDKEVQWVESTEKAEEDKDGIEWLGTTKKSGEHGWFLATSSKEGEGGGHMGGESHNMVGQWFEASVEDLGQLEIFDLPPALNVHVEVTAGELKEYKEK